MFSNVVTEAINSTAIGRMNIYRHFKGGYYVVLSVATDEPTGDEVVVYQSLQDGKVWTRPLSVFQEPVPDGKENPTGQSLRFEKVKDFHNQLCMIPTDLLMSELLKREDCPAELKSLNRDNVWREEYLIGRFYDEFIDENTSYEDFSFYNVADSFEDAVNKIKRVNDTRMRVLKRVYIKQDFD